MCDGKKSSKRFSFKKLNLNDNEKESPCNEAKFNIHGNY